MKFVSYKCDCGCYFAIHTFNDSNNNTCPACADSTGVAFTNEIEVEEKKGFNEIVKHLENVGFGNYKSTTLLEKEIKNLKEIVEDQKKKIKWYQVLIQIIDKFPN